MARLAHDNSLYPLSEMDEQITTLLELSKDQLQVLELAKHDPQVLDKAILGDALETVRDQTTVFSFFRKHCNRWQEEAATDEVSKKTQGIKDALHHLEKINKQILFLMGNLLEFAGDHAYTDEDLEDLPDILEVLKRI